MESIATEEEINDEKSMIILFNLILTIIHNYLNSFIFLKFIVILFPLLSQRKIMAEYIFIITMEHQNVYFIRIFTLI